MNFDEKIVEKIFNLFYEKHEEITNKERDPTSAWNSYLKKYKIRVVNGFGKDHQKCEERILRHLVDIINFRNKEVVDCVVIENPHKQYKKQLLIIPAETAQKILVIGMI